MHLQFLIPLALAAVAPCLGQSLADAVRRDNPPLESPLVQDYVARLGRQLSQHAPGPNLPYTFTVIVDSWAFSPIQEPVALPGGTIFVPVRLILEAHDTAELAGMLAHAIAHVANGDCTYAEARTNLTQTGAIAAALSSGCWVGPTGGPAVPMSYLQSARTYERRADLQAVEILSKAGFDPAAFVGYIRRVQADNPRKPGTVSRVFSVQPPVEERVAAMEKAIASLAPERSYSAGEDLEPIQTEVRKLTQPKDSDPKKPTLIRGPGSGGVKIKR